MKLLKIDIEKMMDKYESQFKKYFQDLNDLPEPSLQEFKTAEYIANALTNLGIKFTKLSTNNGLFGELNFNKEQTFAFRADIDALPLDQGGYAHMCGHSIHSSALLTTLHMIVKEGIEVPFNLRFVFQPAEEIGAGAEITLAEKAYEKVDYAIGIHNMNMPANSVLVGEGATLSGAALSKITIYGPGGHSSFSNELPNPLIDLMRILVKIDDEVNQHDLKKVEASFAVSLIEGSKKRNILAEKVEAQMYYHYYEEETFSLFKDIINKHAVINDKRLKIEVKHEVIIPPTFNKDVELLNFIAKKLENTKMKTQREKDPHLNPSDDFAYVMNKHTGVYIMVGIEKDKPIGIYHTPEYDANDGDGQTLWRFWTSLITSDQR